MLRPVGQNNVGSCSNPLSYHPLLPLCTNDIWPLLCPFLGLGATSHGWDTKKGGLEVNAWSIREVTPSQRSTLTSFKVRMSFSWLSCCSLAFCSCSPRLFTCVATRLASAHLDNIIVMGQVRHVKSVDASIRRSSAFQGWGMNKGDKFRHHETLLTPKGCTGSWGGWARETLTLS